MTKTTQAEMVKASTYYGRKTPGWVALINGHPMHLTGPSAKAAAQLAVDTATRGNLVMVHVGDKKP